MGRTYLGGFELPLGYSELELLLQPHHLSVVVVLADRLARVRRRLTEAESFRSEYESCNSNPQSPKT